MWTTGEKEKQDRTEWHRIVAVSTEERFPTEEHLGLVDNDIPFWFYGRNKVILALRFLDFLLLVLSVRRDLFGFFGSGLLEVPDPLTEPLADLGEFAGSEDYQNNNQNDEQFRHTETKHVRTSLRVNLYLFILVLLI